MQSLALVAPLFPPASNDKQMGEKVKREDRVTVGEVSERASAWPLFILVSDVTVNTQILQKWNMRVSLNMKSMEK